MLKYIPVCTSSVFLRSSRRLKVYSEMPQYPNVSYRRKVEMFVCRERKNCHHPLLYQYSREWVSQMCQLSTAIGQGRSNHIAQPNVCFSCRKCRWKIEDRRFVSLFISPSLSMVWYMVHVYGQGLWLLLFRRIMYCQWRGGISYQILVFLALLSLGSIVINTSSSTA